MFGKEFYPTPSEVIKIMLNDYLSKRHRGGINGWEEVGYKLDNLTILEPSAGKGDIIDEILGENHRYEHQLKDNIFCIEINPELQSILKGKGFNIVGTDFLSYTTDTYYDLIIMNPPFSNGDEHLLKAWQILKDGKIICLLNSETINNPFSKKRKELKAIIDEFGSTKDLGNCFDTAERKTGVNVTMVTLQKIEEDTKFNFEFESKTKEDIPDISEESLKNEIAVNDIIGNMLIRYSETKNSFLNYLKARDQLCYHSEGLTDNKSIIEIADESLAGNNKQSYNLFAKNLRSRIWHKILNESNVRKYMSSRVQNEFSKFIKEQGLIELTKENIYAVIQHIFDQRINIMDQAIIDAFNIMTLNHESNRSYQNEWKTNDKWKVNRKIIMPWWINFGSYDSQEYYRAYGSRFSVDYSYRSELNDIHMALCYIAGINSNSHSDVYHQLNWKFKQLGALKPGEKFDNSVENVFFEVKFYKKNSLHLIFKDKDLWEKFNHKACSLLKWLPEKETDEWKKKKRDRESSKPSGKKAKTNKPIVYEYKNDLFS